MKFIVAVLHSSVSMRKWSRTSNVNAVFGFWKLAGKSFARRRSWTYWSDDLAQWHHRIERWKIPVDEMMINFDRNPCGIPDGPEGGSVTSSPSPSSEIWRPCIIGISTLNGRVGQSPRSWQRSNVSSCVRSSDCSKKCPFHISIRWNGSFVWAETQQALHHKLDPKQSWQRCVPEDCWQFEHNNRDGIDSCRSSSMRMPCLRVRYSSRNSFWVCWNLSDYIFILHYCSCVPSQLFWIALVADLMGRYHSHHSVLLRETIIVF